jgi:pimeloyl-CoA dehydrogenase
MNFELNAEQAALADSLSRLLADRYTFERRRALVAAGQRHDPATWRGLAELGLTALPVPEAHGGFGGGARDLLPVMQAMGAALVLEPFLASAVLGTAIVCHGADQAMQARLLPGLASGERIVTWAHDEPEGRHAPVWIETRAEQRDGRWVLSGIKSPVLAADLAHHIVVTTRVAGRPDQVDGCALFLLEPGSEGVDLRSYTLVDDTAAGELRLQSAVAEPLHDPADGALARRAISLAQARGIAAACADMVGAAQAAFDLTMTYLRTRRQFGRLIGENQALRHRAADMLVSLEMARSMAIAAAVAADDPQGEEAVADLHRAKLSVARHTRLVAHGAIQLHGGIGMTEEYAVGHSLRRIHVLDQLLGDADAHLGRLAAALS